MLTDYVVIDLEMTGLNAKTDRILETGAARVRGNVVTATFSKIINPKRELSEKVISLTGITNEMRREKRRMQRLPHFLISSERIFWWDRM